MAAAKILVSQIQIATFLEIASLQATISDEALGGCELLTEPSGAYVSFPASLRSSSSLLLMFEVPSGVTECSGPQGR
jgi:hypothetical protein